MKRQRRQSDVIEEDTLNDRIRKMIRELERALSGAVSDSEDVHEVLRRLREEGYDLAFVVDRRDGDEPAPQVGRASVERSHSAGSVGEASLTRLSPPAGGEVSAPPAGANPRLTFRIDTADLAFLRSIGIDPTRRIRGRRASRKPSE